MAAAKDRFVELDSRHRVAFDLMSRIAALEPDLQVPKDREYYLKLYGQCLAAVDGRAAERATTETRRP